VFFNGLIQSIVGLPLEEQEAWQNREELQKELQAAGSGV